MKIVTITWQHKFVISVLINAASAPVQKYQEIKGSQVFVLQSQSISDHIYGEFSKSLETVRAVPPLPHGVKQDRCNTVSIFTALLPNSYQNKTIENVCIPFLTWCLCSFYLYSRYLWLSQMFKQHRTLTTLWISEFFIWRESEGHCLPFRGAAEPEDITAVVTVSSRETILGLLFQCSSLEAPR